MNLGWGWGRIPCPSCGPAPRAPGQRSRRARRASGSAQVAVNTDSESARLLLPWTRFQTGRGTVSEGLPHPRAPTPLSLPLPCSLQVFLNTYGIQTQTPQQVEPIQIWAQQELVKVGGRVLPARSGGQPGPGLCG